ncbi:insulin-like growth factor 2 mRNA-binding protein 3 [Anneissia japonica]|uniref:insulin-like growth factor 2 mRNA-binding protein 3 n=1 Tax=Anneissia japonica TaxID=1529436 RepID=UPI00142571E0|nr:insulin-like growth factor 2 mRNA-binding protein 3 [Anneissia japonica]
MNKIFVGNVSNEVTEDNLRRIFEENGVPPTSVLIKTPVQGKSDKTFAFVDVDSQELADKAIEKLDGYNLLGSVIAVEHSVPKRGRNQGGNAGQNAQNGVPRKPTMEVRLHNIPLQVSVQDVERLLNTFGSISKCDKGAEGKNGYTVYATYKAPEQAQQAVHQLNGYEYEGSNLKVRYHNGPRGQRRYRNQAGFMNNQRGPGRSKPDFLIRMLVPSELVGAIIGKGGAKIQETSNSTSTRIDVHRKENPGSAEKAVTIFGLPENCAKASSKIHETMVSENQTNNKGADVPLKLLVHNALVGRLIGVGGRTLKKIIDDTKATIRISPIYEMTYIKPERTVFIRGSDEQCEAAVKEVTQKLFEIYQNHVQNVQQQQQHNLFPGLDHMALFSGMGNMPQYNNMYNGGFNMNEMTPNQGGILPGLYYPQGGQNNQAQQHAQVSSNETAFLYIPKDSVGALIGVKGKHIQEIARKSSASIKIAPADDDTNTERKVTVIGSPEAQWKAQFYIYDKIRREGFFGSDEVRLASEVAVPGRFVGHIIGKKGRNVRELQRVTSARVEVPKNDVNNGSGDANPDEVTDENEKEVFVRIFGHFYSAQAAQRRIRRMLQDFYMKSSNYQQYASRRSPALPAPPQPIES